MNRQSSRLKLFAYSLLLIAPISACAEVSGVTPTMTNLPTDRVLLDFANAGSEATYVAALPLLGVKSQESIESRRQALKLLYSSQDSWGRLQTLIASGDRRGVEVGIGLLDLSDGGALEDLLRSLGIAFSNHTNVLRNAMASIPNQEVVCSAIVNSLPLEAVDDIPAQIAAVDARLESLRSQMMPAGIKCTEAFKQLNDFRKLLEQHLPEQ
jgi:hypothetical protein